MSGDVLAARHVGMNVDLAGREDGRPVRVAAAEVGDQDDAVTEETDAGASGHDAFLQLDVGDAAFVDPGVVRGGDALGDSLAVFAQGSGKAGRAVPVRCWRGRRASQAGRSASRLSSMAANRRTRSWAGLSSGQWSRSRGRRSLMCGLRRSGWVVIQRAASRGEGGRSRGSSRGRPRREVRRPFSRAGSGRSSPWSAVPRAGSSRCVLPRPSVVQVVEVGIQSGRLAGRRRTTSCQVRARAYLLTVRRSRPSSRATELWAPARTGQGVHGLEQPSGVALGPCVRRGVLDGLLNRSGSISRRGQRGRQAAAVSGSHVLDAAGEALPEVKTVADLHGVGYTR